MEMVGWAAATVTAFGGLVAILGYVFDQIPPLSDKAAHAIESLRRLRRTWRGDGESDVDDEPNQAGPGERGERSRAEADDDTRQPQRSR